MQKWRNRSYQNEKESYIVTFNQYLESLRLNTYVSLARNTYWDASSNVNYSLSLSRDFDIGPLKNVSTSLTFSRINWEEPIGVHRYAERKIVRME